MNILMWLPVWDGLDLNLSQVFFVQSGPKNHKYKQGYNL